MNKARRTRRSRSRRIRITRCGDIVGYGRKKVDGFSRGVKCIMCKHNNNNNNIFYTRQYDAHD